LEPYKLPTKTVVNPKLDPPYNVPGDEQDFMQQWMKRAAHYHEKLNTSEKIRVRWPRQGLNKHPNLRASDGYIMEPKIISWVAAMAEKRLSDVCTFSKAVSEIRTRLRTNVAVNVRCSFAPSKKSEMARDFLRGAGADDELILGVLKPEDSEQWEQHKGHPAALEGPS